MDKRALCDQLARRLREGAAVAQRASVDAAIAARDAATPQEKREDARLALEYGGLAKGQAARAEKARAELAALEAFRPPRLSPNARISVGAIVEVGMQRWAELLAYDAGTIFAARVEDAEPAALEAALAGAGLTVRRVSGNIT